MSFGQRLAWSRTERGLKLQQVSSMTGIGVGYLSEMEKGIRRNPSLDILQRLADALKVSVAFLVGEDSMTNRGEMHLPAPTDIASCFDQYVTVHSSSNQTQMAIEDRVKFVVAFLLEQFPNRIHYSSLAYELGTPVRDLNTLLFRSGPIDDKVVERLTRLTGIPLGWFSETTTEGPSKRGADQNDFACRLQWARIQLGYTLQDLSTRSELAVGYISQLETGAKCNPTLAVIRLISKTLNVPLSFLMGESEMSELDTEGWRTRISEAFEEYLRGLSIGEQRAIRSKGLEDHFALAVRFLQEQWPTTFSIQNIAFNCGITMRSLNDILERGSRVSPFLLDRFCQLTGIAKQFFISGSLLDQGTRPQYDDSRRGTHDPGYQVPGTHSV